MSSVSVTISVTRYGREQTLSPDTDPVRSAGDALLAYADASDVTISIGLPGDHGTLLIALEAGSALVGLVTADGVYQYVSGEAGEGTCQFMIGGQLTFIDNRYVLPVAAAACLLTPWLGGTAPLTSPAFERQ